MSHRRDFLRALGLGAGAVLVGKGWYKQGRGIWVRPHGNYFETVRAGAWNDPATWRAALVPPQAGAHVRIGHEVIVSGLVRDANLDIQPQGQLAFTPTELNGITGCQIDLAPSKDDGSVCHWIRLIEQHGPSPTNETWITSNYINAPLLI